MNTPQIILSSEQSQILLKYFPTGVISLDFETTGLSPLIDKVVEISAVKITPDSSIEIFDQLINPQTTMREEIINIHHITNEMVQSSPLISKILPQFKEFIADIPIIAHNAKFDAGFLISSVTACKMSIENFKNKIYCSLALTKKLIKDSKNHKLITLSQYFDTSLVNHHRALDDAIACLDITSKTLIQYSNSKFIKKAFEHSFIFSLKDFRRNTDITLPDNMKEIIPAMHAAKEIKIKYSGGSHKGVFRSIIPVALLPLPSGNVLYAKCLISLEYKTFKLKKIVDIQIND